LRLSAFADHHGLRAAVTDPGACHRLPPADVDGRGVMICRIWRGWTTRANADEYESIVRGQVIPGIETMRVPGFRHIDLMRRELEDEVEVEFLTAMWFDDVESIKAFVGEDYETSHVPPAARAVLAHFDESSAHYTVLERRAQPNGRA
jgi:hypothetical protein